MTNKICFGNLALALLLCFLTLPIVAGCRTTQSTVQFQPEETHTAEAVSEDIALEEIGSVQVGIEPTPAPERTLYTNDTYGFKFEYPDSWTLAEKDNGVLLQKGSSRLVIKFRWTEEDFNLGPGGVAAGEFTSTDKFSFLGQIIPVEALIYKGKTKAVFYGQSGYNEIDNRAFLIILDDVEF